MEAIEFVFGHFGEFFALMFRLGGLFLIAPVFSNDAVPMRIRGGLVFFISLISFPTLVANDLLPQMTNLGDLIIVGSGEMLVGYTIGFFLNFIINLMQMSGRFYSIQMGFGIINVFDPLAEASVPIISQLKTILMTVIFLLLNGHHLLIDAVFKSYQWIPTAAVIDFGHLNEAIYQEFDHIFDLAFLIGVPLIGVVFLVSITLGLLTKLAPQMHVMMIGFGIKVMLGVSTFIFLAPGLFEFATDVMFELFDKIFRLLQNLPQ